MIVFGDWTVNLTHGTRLPCGSRTMWLVHVTCDVTCDEVRPSPYLLQVSGTTWVTPPVWGMFPVGAAQVTTQCGCPIISVPAQVGEPWKCSMSTCQVFMQKGTRMGTTTCVWYVSCYTDTSGCLGVHDYIGYRSLDKCINKGWLLRKVINNVLNISEA